MSNPIDRLSDALSDRYRIEAELGAGGMATVYLAHDVKHDRKVALKVLRPELAAVIGAERFLVEIKTTANLQHPHILPLHDSGEVEGTVFYVMPFIEGESLRERLNREKQLPVGDATRIATEVAGALDYAHRKGIIHRDIKPENILLHDGRALVADFGIALAAANTGGTRMTETGMSLGTPHYMSPEQAMGERDLDARTDVYALGCVLYEMLTGEPPFDGPTAQAIVAKVMTVPPVSPQELRKTVPASVDAATLTALQKLPADRFAGATEFALALGDPSYRGTEVLSGGVTAKRGRAEARLIMHPLVLTLVGAVAVLGVVAIRGWTRPPPPQPVRRYQLLLEDFYIESYDTPAISPDGSLLVYSSHEGVLGRRRRDELRPLPIPNTENAWSPTFSPNGTRVAFVTGFPGALRYVPLSGGSAVTIVGDSVHGQGLAWGEDGWIYYSGGAPGELALWRVREDGGAAEIVARPDSTRDELFYFSPALVDGGRGVLFTIWRRTGLPDIGVVDLESGAVKTITGGTTALHTPSGHIVIARTDGGIYAAPFDANRLELRAAPVLIEQGLQTAVNGVSPMALGREGTLVYEEQAPPQEVVRVGRDGGVTRIDPAWAGNLWHVSVSPTGDRLAFASEQNGRMEVWVKELDTGPAARLAALGRYSYRPTWTPDGRSVLFISDGVGHAALFSVAADGSAAPEIFLRSPRSVDEGTVSDDGAWLIYRQGSGGGREVYARRLDGDTSAIDLMDSGAEEFSPSLSPDGRWLAYASTESGSDEVYVRPFPNARSARSQVSRNGGSAPLWSHSGRELFYRNGSDELVAVTIADEPNFRVASEQVLFSTSDYLTDNRHRAYTVSPDDQSFFFIRRPSGEAPHFVIVLNWFEELRRKAR